jgi:hypothetical protein
METLNTNEKEEILNKELILESTDKWLIAKTIESIGDNNYVFYDQLFGLDKIVIKVFMESNIELEIYKLVKKFNYYLPNMPKIYGVYRCYENRHILDKIVNEYNEKNNKNVKLPLCNGINGNKNPDNVRIRFLVMEKIKGKTLQSYFPYNTILPDNLFISILMQGLYQIYQLYYVFGIVINDYHLGNILIEQNTDEYIEYKFQYHPYRFYRGELECFADDTSYDTKLKLYGFKIYLIDFDNGQILHSDYSGNGMGEIKINIMKQIKTFVKNISKYASKNVIDKLRSIYDNDIVKNSRIEDKFIDCCNYKLNDYNKIKEKDWSNNELLLIKTSRLIVSYIKEIVKIFDLPKEYILFIN